jgi:hypothetical protein
MRGRATLGAVYFGGDELARTSQRGRAHVERMTTSSSQKAERTKCKSAESVLGMAGYFNAGGA